MAELSTVAVLMMSDDEIPQAYAMCGGCRKSVEIGPDETVTQIVFRMYLHSQECEDWKEE